MEFVTSVLSHKRTLHLCSFALLIAASASIIPYMNDIFRDKLFEPIEIAVLYSFQPILLFSGAHVFIRRFLVAKAKIFTFVFALLSILLRFSINYVDSFWAVLPLQLFADLFMCPVLHIFHTSMKSQGMITRREINYMTITCRATIAFIIGSIVSATNNFSQFFYCYFVFAILFLVSLWPIEIEDKDPSTDFAIWKDYDYILDSLPNLILSIVLVTVGLASSFQTVFLFVLIKDLDGSELIMGLSILTRCLAEIMFYLIPGKSFSDKRPILIFCVCLSICALGGQLYAFSMLEQPWYVIFIELLSGLSFALMRITSIRLFRQQLVAVTLKAQISEQIYDFMYFGAGPIFGCFFGGFLYKWDDHSTIFLVGSFICFVSFILVLFLICFATKTAATSFEFKGESTAFDNQLLEDGPHEAQHEEEAAHEDDGKNFTIDE